MGSDHGLTYGDELMRTAIFTDKEREMAKHYLETGKKGESFRVLIHRCRRNHAKINEDLGLMNRLLESAGKTNNE